MKTVFIPVCPVGGSDEPAQWDANNCAWAYATRREAELEVCSLVQGEIAEVQEGLRTLDECQFDADVLEVQLTDTEHPEHAGALLAQASEWYSAPLYVVLDSAHKLNKHSRRCFLVLISNAHSRRCELWSSPEWEQSRCLKDHEVSVLFMTNGKDFDEASNMMQHVIGQEGSRYAWAAKILKLD